MKTKIYKILILTLCLFALTIVAQAQLPDFTRIDTGAVSESNGAHYAGGWFDMDKDGDMDLIIANAGMYYHNHPNLLYRNERNGLFVRIIPGFHHEPMLYTPAPGPIGDIDNDGTEDLIYWGYQAISHLVFMNDGYGKLVYDTSYLTLNQPFLIDLNNDSFLDLLQISDNGFISLNDGTGNFLTPAPLNISENPNYGLHGASWGDADGDGDFDLFCGYTYWTGFITHAPNALYINNGDTDFERYSNTSGVFTDTAMTGCSNWIDYDNDGDMDLYVLNSWLYADSTSHSGRLYINKGNLQFEKYIFEPDIYKDSHKVSSAWGDLDNDGDLDLYITIEKNDFGNGGHQSPTKVNLLFENDGNGQLIEITNHSLVEESSHGVTFTDHDNDGDLDVLLIRYSWSNDGHNNFFINEGNDNSWLILTCEGTLSNKTAIGTRVIAKATINGQPVMQTREITPMHGHFTYPSLRVHFGLGDADLIDTLFIRWPSGHVDEYLNVKVNQFYRAIEDSEFGIDFKATNYIEYSPAISDIELILEDETIMIDLNNHYNFIMGDTIPEIIGDTLTYEIINEDTNVVSVTLDGSILTLNACDSNGLSKIQIICEAGFTKRMDHFNVDVTVGIETHFAGKNITVYPNPFSSSTTFEYELQHPATVQITIYNHLGETIEVIQQTQSSGKQQVVWDAEGLPAGIYYIVMKTESGMQTMKMIKL